MNQKILMVLLIFLSMPISKGEIMDHVALVKFDMEKEHAVYPYDQSEAYIHISNEDKENLISTMGNPSHMTWMGVMTIGIS